MSIGGTLSSVQQLFSLSWRRWYVSHNGSLWMVLQYLSMLSEYFWIYFLLFKVQQCGGGEAQNIFSQVHFHIPRRLSYVNINERREEYTIALLLIKTFKKYPWELMLFIMGVISNYKRLLLLLWIIIVGRHRQHKSSCEKKNLNVLPCSFLKCYQIFSAVALN